MCGIVAYIGPKDIPSVILVGLERLSYRGYDSAGISVMANNDITTWKNLESYLISAMYLKH